MILKIGPVITGTQSGTINSSLPIQSSTPNVNVGDFMVVGAGIRSSAGYANATTTPAVTDTLGNSYVSVSGGSFPLTFGGFAWQDLYVGFITNPGTLALTLNWNALQPGAALGMAARFTGVYGYPDPLAALDKLESVPGTGTTIAVGPTLTTDTSNQLLIEWSFVTGLRTLTSASFSAVGPSVITDIDVPETAIQSTGTDNSTGQMSEATYSYPDQFSFMEATSGGNWGAMIATFLPTNVDGPGGGNLDDGLGSFWPDWTVYPLLYQRNAMHRLPTDQGAPPSTDTSAQPHKAGLPQALYEFEPPWAEWAAFMQNRMHKIPADKFPGPPAPPAYPGIQWQRRNPYFVYDFEQSWDTWEAFFRNAMHRVPADQFPQPTPPPPHAGRVRRIRFPYDMFDFEQSWWDWAALYQNAMHRIPADKFPKRGPIILVDSGPAIIGVDLNPIRGYNDGVISGADIPPIRGTPR